MAPGEISASSVDAPESNAYPEAVLPDSHTSHTPRTDAVEEAACFIDGFGPLPVERPRSAAEVGDLVRRAGAAGQAVYPVGGGTQLGLGLPPTKPGTAADLRSLDGVLDYPARDMTVTVQAGVTLAALQRLLAGENQRLPIDVPRPEAATVGGTLAANVSGPRRFCYGTPRDYVLGMSTVNDEGHEVKAGGRVVKNVAGYDLPKLHVGALGTLGVITQVTLKLRPLPEETALLALGCGDEVLGPLLEQLHATRTRPVSLDVLNGPAARALAAGGTGLPADRWVVVVGFEDNAAAVAWQVRQLIEEVAPAGIIDFEARAGVAAAALWQGLTELDLRPEARLSFKANLLPGALAAFCRHAAGLPDEVLLLARAGSGIVRGHLGGDLTADRAAAILKGLQELATGAKGNVVLSHCPPEWKRSLPVWGAPRGDAWLMHHVKEVLDPRGVFNPGRFPWNG
jgi:glycolate oxidase FAD binding subunit